MIIFVSHKLSEIIEVCDSVVVLRNGEKVLLTETSEVTKDDLVFAMTGKAKAPCSSTITGGKA